MKTEPTINIQDEVAKIHAQYGITEMANYRIEKLFEKYVKQSSPKIKQLEWEHGLYRLLSKTSVGDYTIAPMKNGYHMYLYSKKQYYWLKDYVNTIEEAKQFAQTDFENRVKECLITE